MRSFSIGMVGAGIIARNHIEAALKIPEVKLSCISDIVFERALMFAEEFGISPYKDYREMFKKEILDIVIVAVPVFLHKEVVVEAAANNIHVLVEKPMALNVDECEAMIAACDLNGIKMLIGHTQGYRPENIKAHSIMTSGTLGSLLMINDKRYYDYFNEKRPLWCLKKESAGGGVMMNIGAHSIDKVLFMSGSRVKRVTGSVGSIGTDYDVEGYGQMHIEMDNGITSVITQNGYSNKFEAITEYIFTKGIMKVEFPPRITIAAEDREWEENFDQEEDPFVLQIRELINSIKENRRPKTDGEYGLEVIWAVTGIY